MRFELNILTLILLFIILRVMLAQAYFTIGEMTVIRLNSDRFCGRNQLIANRETQ